MEKWLLGEIKNLPKDRLPSIGDVLRGYYYNHLVLKTLKQNSIVLVTKEMIQMWKEAGKSTSEPKNVARKINGLLGNFERLKKGKKRRSKPQIAKEKDWKKKLKHSFDIAPQKSKVVKRKKENEVLCSINEEDSDDLSGSDHSNESDDDIDYSNNLSDYHKKQLIQKSVTSASVLQKIINSPDVSSALDRTNIECGKFAIVAAAIGRVCGDDVSNEVFSLSTLKRRREKHRSEIATSIGNEFDQQEKKILVVHWDGKRMKDVTNPDKACIDNKIDRIAIVVNGHTVNKIIKVSRAEDGTGLVVSELVYEKLQDAGVLANIIGMCTDTTLANTGNAKGACVRFERKMNKKLLYFACQHHIHEIVLGGVYVSLFGSTNGPEEALFLRLKNNWSSIENKNDYKVRM